MFSECCWDLSKHRPDELISLQGHDYHQLQSNLHYMVLQGEGLWTLARGDTAMES